MSPSKITKRNIAGAMGGVATVLAIIAMAYFFTGSGTMGVSTSENGPTLTMHGSDHSVARNNPSLSSVWEGDEERSPLSSVTFMGRARTAYALANELPSEVLNEIYCYCDCEQHSGHKSLLSCWVDQHGANCDVCMAELELVYGMYNEGASVEQIEQAIDQKFYHQVT